MKASSIILGNLLVFIGNAFGLLETWYFGWNFLPRSLAEVLCDIAAAALIVIGAAFLYSARRRPV